MKILKNKTYNDLMLRLTKSESDLKKEKEKCDRIQSEFNIYKESIKENLNYLEDNLDKEQVENSKLVVEIKEKTEFISSLNERVQKAELHCEKIAKLLTNAISENSKLMSEKLELESKLSRKGLGVKGKKKENVIVEQQIDESQITEVIKEPKCVEITLSEQLRKYDRFPFIAEMFVNGKSNIVEGIVLNNNITNTLAFNNEEAGWNLDSIQQSKCNGKYQHGWTVFNEDFGTHIKSLKILL